MPQGPITSFVSQLLGKTTFSAGLLDAQRGQLASQLNADYYASTYGPFAPASGKAGQSFTGANQAAAATTAGLATTYTGLCLSNPAGSGVNLVVKTVGFAVLVAGADALGLITGWAAGGITVHTTPLNTSITPNYVGAATASGSAVITASKANLDAACTLVGTPLWNRWLSNSIIGTNFVGGNYVDLRGALVIPPGGYVATGTNAAIAGSAFFGSFSWDELPQ